MKQKKSIEEIKALLGLDNINPEVNGREKLEKMIDPNKYYLVICHSLPFKGSTILKRNFQPSLILQDLGNSLTKKQWAYFNELKDNRQWIEHLDTQQPTQPQPQAQ